MTIDELKNFILKNYRAELVEDFIDKIVFKIQDKKVELNKNDFELASKKLNSLGKEETEIYNSNYYEILVRDVSRVFFGREKEFSIDDSVNGYKYSYGKPSDTYRDCNLNCVKE